MTKRTLQSLINLKIQRSQRNVFLRADFVRMGGYDQVGRALRNLVAHDQLIKIGYGLYAKARPGSVTGKSVFSAKGGFKAISEEALKRLKIKWQPTTATKTYQTGSTQIPDSAEVIIRQRFNRKIGTGSYRLRVFKGKKVNYSEVDHDQLSFNLHCVIKNELISNPARVLSIAKRNLSNWKKQYTSEPKWMSDWEEIINNGISSIIEILDSHSEKSILLRSSSPFAGVISNKERMRIIREERKS